MTDFSRNQLAAINFSDKQIDRWVMPNDRQLQLRSKLGQGWSVRSNESTSSQSSAGDSDKVSEEERAHILAILEKASLSDKLEQERVGLLVFQYEQRRSQSCGDGISKCVLCAESIVKFRSKPRLCMDCHKGVCDSCSVDIVRKGIETQILCKICSEKRELWKKSGAWLINELPPHIECHKKPSSNHSRVRYSPYASPTRSPRLSPHPADSFSDSDTNLYNNGDRLSIHRIGTQMSSNSESLSSLGDNSIGSFNPSGETLDGVSDSGSFNVTSNIVLNSAQRSVSDVDLVSVPPTANTTQTTEREQQHDNEQTIHTEAKKGVKFDIESTSTSNKPETSYIRCISKTDSPYARCLSIPDAMLDDVNYLDVEDTESPLGSLIFTLFYHEVEQKLDVELLEAKHLLAMDSNQSSDPYVKLNLVPSYGKARKQRSSTIYVSLAPRWNEKFEYFGVSMDDLLVKTLLLTVMDEDKLSTDDIIGEFRLPLRQIKPYELTHYHVYLETKVNLTSDETIFGEERGKIKLSLRFDKQNAQLHVTVVRCAALQASSPNAFADPYVKIYLQPDYSKSSKKKTNIVRKSLNPEFHEEFLYKIDLNSLSRRTLQVTVWDHHMTKNTLIGGVCLSVNSAVESERSQWVNTIQQPDQNHDFWHTLRDLQL